MMATVYTCDRCGASEALPYGMVLVEEYSPRAFRGNPPIEDPQGWLELRDDDSVTDVCPACVTDSEQVDVLLCAIEADRGIR